MFVTAILRRYIVFSVKQNLDSAPPPPFGFSPENVFYLHPLFSQSVSGWLIFSAITSTELASLFQKEDLRIVQGSEVQ